MYVHNFLGGFQGDFGKYFYGMFDKSFSTLSEILAEATFVVDLSVLKHDGGVHSTLSSKQYIMIAR